MAWSFSVALPADPTACGDAAATLRSAARAALAAADVLAEQAAMSSDDFSGVAAQSYRAAAAALEEDCRGSATDTGGLADALDAYASRIRAVRSELARIRAEAMRTGLGVTHDDWVPWPPAPTTEQDRTFRRLEAAAAAAHRDATSAYDAWWRAVQGLTKGPLPSRS
jgi:hypothetical protein